MPAHNNPFTPGFGQVPPFMAGRRYVMEDIRDAFSNGPGDPNLTTIFTGARGTGKTTLLLLLSHDAESLGWVPARVSAVPGMLEDILQQAAREGAHLLEPAQKTRLSSIGVGGMFNVSWEQRPADAPQPNWRSRLTALLDEFEQHDCGLVITVDEIRASFDEMVQLASVYQHLVGERRKVALLMAGLPYQVSRVLNDKSISFLRRAARHHLGRIPDNEIASALVETVRAGGYEIEEDALQAAVEAIDGFPFMMQLVGYRMWTRAKDGIITAESASQGIASALREMRENILETTYEELSDGDLAFVEAMLPDEGPSTISDVTKRLGKSSGYAAQYRKRLLEEGVIGERGRGKIDFELPGWRDFVTQKLTGDA